uniref:ELMO domain containing 2 n=1 Tax=Naja naja TaxID=35670 RepID=A0A8C6XUW2_NAJNA
MIIDLWRYFYTNIFRFWLKWIVRLVTGKCELQRICNGTRKNAKRTLRIEYSLESSKHKSLQNALNATEDEVEKCVACIIEEKKIKVQKDTGFASKLQSSLLQISGYKKLCLAVEDLKKQVYNSDNKEHEEQLMELWNLLMPHEKLKARITKQWCDIGFQGDDPKTDFRGMGMLGLTNLLYFSKHYPHEARRILIRSNHPKLGRVVHGHVLYSAPCPLHSAPSWTFKLDKGWAPLRLHCSILNVKCLNHYRETVSARKGDTGNPQIIIIE